MKLIPVASLLVLFQFGGANSSQCKDTCKNIRQHLLLTETHTCSPALTINPSPTVYKSCQDGKKKAFEKACVPLCSNAETTFVASVEATNACKRQRGRGNSEHWCRRGYASIIKKLQSYSFPISEPSQENPEEVILQADLAEAEENSEERTIPAEDNVEEPKDESLLEPEEEEEEEEEEELVVLTQEQAAMDNDLDDENIVTEDASLEKPESDKDKDPVSVQDDDQVWIEEEVPDADHGQKVEQVDATTGEEEYVEENYSEF